MAFDPRRMAILLLGGDKSNRWAAWYRENVPIADDLYDALVSGGYAFWDHIHPIFLSRDITRHDVRELVVRGLRTTHGNYRALLKLFGIPTEDYKRFHNFLMAHGCKVDYRSFRQGTPEPSRRPQALLPPLGAAADEPPHDRRRST